MPQVVINAQLRFTNHWIGIYGKGTSLVPVRSTVHNSPPLAPGATTVSAPADPGTLRPLFEQELAYRKQQLGADDPKVARAASDLGLFLSQTGNPSAAEPPLRLALDIDRKNHEPRIAGDERSLAQVLTVLGKREEAFEYFQRASASSDVGVGAESFASLAILDPAHAEQYYRSALETRKNASAADEKETAVLLNDLAMAMEQRKDYPGAEALFRQALAIQQKLFGAESPATAATLSNMGSLLQSAGRLDEAEQSERRAAGIFERTLGPYSAELATSCSNLADVLWAKREWAAAASLYQRAIAIDESVYGLDNQEVAGDLVNYAALLQESGRKSAAVPLLRRALTIYESALGPDSAPARQTRQQLTSTQN